tara:strand:- start:282 stop:953 length:672 start_codon:yes stop_codon:yes gene_type:complete
MGNLCSLFQKLSKLRKRFLPQSKFMVDKSVGNLNLIQDDGNIHVFTDGSYSPRNAKLGMGWLIKLKPDDEVLFYDRKDPVLEIKNEDQNIAAEILAVVGALNTLPVASKIVLHIDLLEIIGVVNGVPIHENSRNISLKDQWTSLLSAVDRHDTVIAEYASDKDRYKHDGNKRMMCITHNLAALASGARTQKPLITSGDTAKYGHLFTDHTIKNASTPNALDII